MSLFGQLGNIAGGSHALCVPGLLQASKFLGSGKLQRQVMATCLCAAGLIVACKGQQHMQRRHVASVAAALRSPATLGQLHQLHLQ